SASRTRARPVGAARRPLRRRACRGAPPDPERRAAGGAAPTPTEEAPPSRGQTGAGGRGRDRAALPGRPAADDQQSLEGGVRLPLAFRERGGLAVAEPRAGVLVPAVPGRALGRAGVMEKGPTGFVSFRFAVGRIRFPETKETQETNPAKLSPGQDFQENRAFPQPSDVGLTQNASTFRPYWRTSQLPASSS